MPLGIATAQAKAGQIFAGLTFRLVLLGIIAALAVNTYADIELKGPLGIGVHFEGWKPKAQRHEDALDKVAEAAVQAEKAAREAKEKAEREYRELAERTDNATIERLETELGNAERFIAANRVCPRDRGSTGRAAPATADNSAGSGDGPGEAPELDGVIVPAEDVRICTENTVRLEAAREWALELIERP